MAELGDSMQITGNTYYWIYFLVFLFMLGTMFIIFNYITYNYIYEPITNNPNVTGFNFTSEDVGYATEYLALWNIVPWILLLFMAMYIIQRMVTSKDQ